MKWLLLGAASLLILIPAIRAANILALNTVTSRSHTIFANVLTRALAARGHKLVVLSPDQETRPNPNITTYYLEGGYEEEILHVTLEDMPPSEGFVDMFSLLADYTYFQCKTLLHSPGNKRFLSEYKNHKFDLILMDVGITECFMKYVHVFGHPPLVAYTAFFTVHPNDMGNFYNPAYVPHYMSDYSDRMTFAERFVNWLQYHYVTLMRRYQYLPTLDKISEEFFGFYEPTIQDLEKEIAIMLTDEHFSFTHPKPTVPAVIEVAGLHIKPAKSLPKDVADFVADAKHGVIYFSLGSNFLSKHMTDERKQMFLKAFSRLPQKVLWKYEDETLSNIPKNVLIRKWFPQTDVLGHNNTVLFMTHNGYLSTQESIYFGVPMLGLPILADQFKNNAKISRAGLGLRLHLKDIKSSQEIETKITTILNNPSFKERAQKLSLLFRDRPMTPLDTAIYWIEYVLRHKGADQLRVASLDLAWYQYYLLDIYLTIAGSIFLVYYVLRQCKKVIFSDVKKEKKA